LLPIDYKLPLKKILLSLLLIPLFVVAQEGLEKHIYIQGDDQWAEKVHPSYDLSWLHKTNFNPKIGGIDFTSDGRMLICTWDSVGAVYELSGVETGDTNQIKVRRIASGLCEPLGVKSLGNKIYVFNVRSLLDSVTWMEMESWINMKTFALRSVSMGITTSLVLVCFTVMDGFIVRCPHNEG